MNPSSTFGYIMRLTPYTQFASTRVLARWSSSCIGRRQLLAAEGAEQQQEVDPAARQILSGVASGQQQQGSRRALKQFWNPNMPVAVAIREAPHNRKRGSFVRLVDVSGA